MVFLIDGLLMYTGWKRRLRVVFFLMCLWYSSSVVVLIVCSSLCASIGFSMFVVSMVFSVALVLMMVCSSSMKRMIFFSLEVIFFRIVLSFFLNSLWYFVLVRSELMFSSKICLSLRLLGMLLCTMCCVRFLMIVVLSIFGLSIRIGLFFVWCDRI